jgi:hypothetical protein
MAYSRTRTRKHITGVGLLGVETVGLFTTTTHKDNAVSIDTCSDETHKGPPYRTGGPLIIAKTQYRRTPSASASARQTSVTQCSYNGKFIPYEALYVPPNHTASSFSAYGAIGWNRTVPDHPIASLGVSIAELKDFPSMIKHAADFFKRAGNFVGSPSRKTVGDLLRSSRSGNLHSGGDYLAAVFGWLPFLRDLQTVLNYRENLDRKLAYMQKRNRSKVRRRMTLHDSTKVELIGKFNAPSVSSLAPVVRQELYAVGSGGSNDPLIVTRYWRKRIWYEAVYAFYVPEAEFNEKPNFLGLTTLESKLLGLQLNAALIYQAMPWSWLIDWFTNAGDVIENISNRANNHIVASHAYVMCQEDIIYKYDGSCDFRMGTWSVPTALTPHKRYTASSQKRYIFKGRVAANPYGFGVTDESLSAYQWSILGALGLTRLR